MLFLSYNLSFSFIETTHTQFHGRLTICFRLIISVTSVFLNILNLVFLLLFAQDDEIAHNCLTQFLLGKFCPLLNFSVQRFATGIENVHFFIQIFNNFFDFLKASRFQVFKYLQFYMSEKNMLLLSNLIQIIATAENINCANFKTY